MPGDPVRVVTSGGDPVRIESPGDPVKRVSVGGSPVRIVESGGTPVEDVLAGTSGALTGDGDVEPPAPVGGINLEDGSGFWQFKDGTNIEWG